MKIDNVADLIAETLAQAGVKRIFGVVGDSLNGLTDALRKRKAIDWIHVRHEEVAAFAAAGEAQITGELAVCAGSCGPGNLHLINGLFDAHRSRTPVLAIAAQIPSAEIGGGYFQETHPQELFRECSHYCELVSDPAQLPYVLENAIRAAVGRRGVAVIVIPGDVALRPAPKRGISPNAGLLPAAPIVQPAEAELEALAELLNGARRVTLFCGRGCAGAHDGLMRLGRDAQEPDRACARRQGARRIRQSLRRRHDRLHRLLVRLCGDACVRRAADAGDRFSLQAVSADGREDRPGRYPAGKSRPPLQARPRPRRRRRRHDRRAVAEAEGEDATASISTTAWLTTRRPAPGSTNSPRARPGKSRSTRNIWRASSASRRRRTRCSPPMSARRRSGRRAISP